MSQKQETINIMTSATSNLYVYIFVQLETISIFFKDRTVNFFLFHHDLTEKAIETMTSYCDGLGNINFYNVYIEDKTFYEEIAENGGHWPSAAYFPLLCHQLLPMSVERILYIDAGDVIFYGEDRNIDEFYQVDFEDNLLVGFLFSTSRVEISTDIVMFDGKIGKNNFVSGVYLINVEGLRENNITEEYYFKVRDKGRARNRDLVQEFFPEFYANDRFYMGDQEFLINAFETQFKSFYGENIDLQFMPYQFMVRYYNYDQQNLWYTPFIVHLHGKPKPWTFSPPPQEKNKIFYDYWTDCYQKAMSTLSFLPELFSETTEQHSLLSCKRSVANLPKVYESSKIVLWGSGLYGQKLAVLFQRFGKDIHCFCDSDLEKSGKFVLNYEIISPTELKSLQLRHQGKFIVIVAVSEKYNKEIIKNCEMLSFEHIMTVEDVKKSFLEN